MSGNNMFIKADWLLTAVNTTLNDQGCPHVTGRFESMGMLLGK